MTSPALTLKIAALLVQHAQWGFISAQSITPTLPFEKTHSSEANEHEDGSSSFGSSLTATSRVMCFII